MAEYAPYLITILIALVGGLFRGFAGFGGGLLMAPLLTIVHPPDVVVPALIVIGLIGDSRLLPEVWKEINTRRVLWISLPTILGLPFGIMALSTLDGDVVRRIVNAIVLVVAILLGRGLRIKSADRPRVLVPAGIMSGILNGIGGIGGPPVVLTYLSIEEPPTSTRANLIGFFSIANSVALVMMFAAGVFAMESGRLAVIAALPYFVSIHFGSKIFRKSGSDSYRRIALIFLGCVAIFGLLWH